MARPALSSEGIAPHCVWSRHIVFGVWRAGRTCEDGVIMDDRIRYLLDELRLTRDARGMTQEDLARHIPWAASTIGMIESGRRKPPPGFWVAVDGALQTGGALARLAARLGSSSWFVDWWTVEEGAVSLRSFQALVVPGLLQTEAYARAVLTEAGLTNLEEAERRLAMRLARKALLTRDNPVDLTAVLDEELLHRPVGGPAVMREQLDALLAACALPHVRLHVVPISAGAYPGLNGPFAIATARDRTETGYLDNQLSWQVIEDPEDLALLQRAWEAVRSEALPWQQSAELIKEVAEKWI
ncbi:helix-turn-helix transcriptional regulator [Plantactinospora sp. ZYX-F-223]|uniref:helix-turn-helix domain-containing protein n=1 Tax=Plantactinospora sp. ZYX-F-223 TaxID=3144103 RepID=UPI0031FC0C61